MSQVNTIKATLRETLGKGASRKLRQAHLIPAVVYGGKEPTLSIAIDPKATTKILQTPLKRNVLIHLELDQEGKQQTKTVMTKDLQVDVVRRNLIHIDFIEVDAKAPVVVQVPLILTGKSEAVTAGGFLEQTTKFLRIKALPTAIPEKIQMDVTGLGFGATHARQIALPSGVELADTHDTTVLTIKMPKVKEETPAQGAASAPAAKK